MAGALVLAACQTQSPAAGMTIIEFRVLHASATCGTEEASVRRIMEPIHLKQILPESGASSPDATTPDPARSFVLRLSMGQQTSGGALFKVRSMHAGAKPGQLDIEMLWAAPDRQRYNTMALTRPCVIVDVGPGDYRQVRLLDAQGRVRATSTLPASR